VLQLVVSNPADTSVDGICVLMRDIPADAQRGYGSLTVDQPGGAISIQLLDDLDLPNLFHGRYGYDMKCLSSDGEAQLLAESAVFVIVATETRSIE
jgi:hypothetical protein